jgi:septal ring factor EnvC (AmiA/AmiB activator)
MPAALPERLALIEDRQSLMRREVAQLQDDHSRLDAMQRRMAGQLKTLREERQARQERLQAAAKLAMFLISGVLLAALNLLAGQWLTALIK